MKVASIILGIVGTLVVGVIGSLIASFLYPPLWDRSVALLVRLVGWVPFRRPPRFAGVWKSTWEVDSSSYPSPVIDERVEIRQLGRRIHAKSHAVHFDFYLVGAVDGGRYITGTWFDETHGGYHGAFQFVVDPATGNFKGVWIGFSKSGVVKHGEWAWERQHAATLPPTRIEDQNQCAKQGGPSNGSQPIGSETNRTSSAAGSCR